MALSYPENTVWYIEVESLDGIKYIGSAVAIRLHEKGNSLTAKTYLLTCAHVIYGVNKNGIAEIDPSKAIIKAWAPHTGFSPDHAQDLKVMLFSDNNISSDFDSNTAKDWVVLEFLDDQSASEATSVVNWSNFELSRYLRIYGYPGGSHGFDATGVVNPTSSGPFEPNYEHQGILGLTGDETRPGMSGSGVFVTGTKYFAGIHRSRNYETLKLKEVSAIIIKQRLYELGYEVAAVPPKDDWYINYTEGVLRKLASNISFKMHDVDFGYMLKPTIGENLINANELINADILCDFMIQKKILGALIYGAGGSGKSAYLGRIARRLIEKYGDEFVPIIVEGGKLDKVQLDVYLNNPADPMTLTQLEELFSNRILDESQSRKTISEIRTDNNGRNIFFLIDGINEIELKKGDANLYGEISRLIPHNDRCIVTARSNSNAKVNDWYGFEVEQISEHNLEHVLKEFFYTTLEELREQGNVKIIDILRNPFFLQLAINNKEKGLHYATRAQFLYEFFRNKRENLGVGIESDETLKNIGEFALNMYRDKGKTWFKISEMQDALGENPCKLLEGSLHIQEEEGIASFNHQLMHDFLVSYYLLKASTVGSMPPAAWQRNYLDDATFHTENPDPLILTVEQFKPENISKNNQFLRCIYDWHLGTAISCLLVANDYGDQNPDSPQIFSGELRTAILALLAARQDDPILHTRKEYEFWKEIFQNTNDADLFEEGKLTSNIKARKFENQWFGKWLDIFCGNQILLRLNAHEIAGDDEVLAWTIANAFKLKGVGQPEDARYLLEMLDNLKNAKQKTIARWRIVHALGAFGDREYAPNLLSQLLKDETEYVWVRYGAGRSLVEMAATQVGEQRQNILTLLEETVKTIAESTSEDSAKQVRILREIGRSVLYEKVEQPNSWVVDVASLVKISSKKVLRDQRYAQIWRSDVLMPFLNGDWIGAPLPEEIREEMSKDCKIE